MRRKLQRVTPTLRRSRRHQDTVVVFAFGVLLGVMLALWLHRRSTPNLSSLWPLAPSSNATNALTSYATGHYDFGYEKWLSRLSGFSENQDPDRYRYGPEAAKYSKVSGFLENSEAHFLYGKVPVVCLIFHPENSKSVSTVVDTWGKHCNEIRFYYSMSRRAQQQKHSEEVVYNATASINEMVDRLELIRKVRVVEIPKAQSEFGLICRALRQVHKHHRKRVRAGTEVPPWILVAPENSFVLTENFRFYVAPMNATAAHYLGHAMKFWGATYNWLDAGYALSWPALTKLVGDGKFRSDAECENGGKFWKNGDWYLGKHLHALGIDPVDTRDHIGRGRFNGYSMRKLLFPGGVSAFERYWRDSLFGASPDGPGCCSNLAITFASGVVSKSKMHQQDYLHHRLRTFSAGGHLGNRPPKVNTINKHPALTPNELLKEQKRMMHFDPTLTTPKSWAPAGGGAH